MSQATGKTASLSAPPVVQRQIVLPLSKAVEIAYKNIRMRLSRSLLVTSGIILALAFLMSIQTSEAILDGMRGWVNPPAGDSHVKQQREALAGKIAALDQEARPLRDKLQAACANPPSLPADAKKADPLQILSKSLADLKQELGVLPGTDDALVTVMSAPDGQGLQVVKDWVAKQRELVQYKQELTAPEQLAAMMKTNGVPTTPQEIDNNRLQTRWLLGLALLVAFAGILNAMLMSVTERFREIGTMKCLGALDSFIIKLFLIESLFQGIIGTVAGIVIGLLLSIGASASAYGGYMWKMFPTGAVVTSGIFCLLVGMGLTVAGAVYPAWQAARMQPIEAMRVET